MEFLFFLLIAWVIYRLMINDHRPPRDRLYCGIFGYSGKDPVDILRLKFLVRENEHRGEDSTGIYGTKMVKAAKSGSQFIFDGDVEESSEGATLVIGHCRKATMGAKTQENAHPFNIDEKVIGTHNGMIFDGTIDELCKTFELPKPNVDSQLIYQILAKNEFDFDTIGDIEGAMALAFIRPEFKNTLYLYRRESRPLSVGWLDGNLWYSSEPQPLWLIDCEDVTTLMPHSLYIFQEGGLLEVIQVKKPFITSLTEDLTITEWLRKATKEERKRGGFVSIQSEQTTFSATHTNRTASAHRNMTGAEIEYPCCEVTRSFNNVTKKNQSGGAFLRLPSDNGEIKLLTTVPVEQYLQSTLKFPDRGKWISSGDQNACYVLIQLLDTRTSSPLVGWTVQSISMPGIVGTTAFNGLVALKFPRSLDSYPHEITITHALRPDCKFTTKIPEIKSGKVLEVAFRIPFPSQEAPQEESQGPATGRPSDLFDWGGVSGHDISDVDIPRITEMLNRNREVPSSLSERRRILPSGYDSRIGMDDLHPDDGTTEEYTVVKNNRLYVIYSKFEPDNDILIDMDLYTSQVTSDEIKKRLEQINGALSSVTSEEDSKDVLMDIQKFLVYLDSYFDNRVRAQNVNDPTFSRDLEDQI